MSDVVIRARNVTKVYRLYAGPGYRFLDMFGMLRRQQGAYTEHAALDGVTLDIHRGEKVAFIGRNGAGKSTFLKLVTGVTQPTSGELELKGKAHALLQIGSGFHPDFTGRANVYAYLAQLGITGAEADQRCAEIVEFAEIEEYIDQPVKTYSSGMAVRLMFSTSTAITPDLLVLDEVLGVGDAYFARKSYDRIRDLCDREKTTLLLVSHDVYSASQICNRMIWLDQGRVMVDLPPADALKVYEESVRLQEEARLRKKTVESIRRVAVSSDGAARDTLIIEVAAAPPPAAGPTYFARVALYRGDDCLAEAPLVAQPSGDAASLVAEGTAWGDAGEWHGRQARPMRHFGSPFHKVAVAFSAAGLAEGVRSGALEVRLEYGAEVPVGLTLRAFLNSRSLRAITLPPVVGGWAEHRAAVEEGDEPAFDQAASGASIGTGAIVIRDARLVDEHGASTFVLQHGRPARLEVDYDIADPALAGPVGVGVAILRGGVETTCRLFTPDLSFDGRRLPRGTIELSIPENWLGTGKYSLTVMLTKQGYADRTGHVFYAISPDVYTCVRDVLWFEVRGGNLFATGTPVLARGTWSTRARQTEEPA